MLLNMGFEPNDENSNVKLSSILLCSRLVVAVWIYSYTRFFFAASFAAKISRAGTMLAQSPNDHPASSWKTAEKRKSGMSEPGFPSAVGRARKTAPAIIRKVLRSTILRSQRFAK